MSRELVGQSVTASYRTVGVTPERMFFMTTTDPVLQRGHLQSAHQVQLRLSATYWGACTSGIHAKFSELRQEDGSYLVRGDLLEHLESLLVVHFDGRTARPRRAVSRRGGRCRVHSMSVDDLPETFGVMSCSRVLGVNYRTVRGWVILGLPSEYRGRRVFIARETLRGWLRSTHRLVEGQ